MTSADPNRRILTPRDGQIEPLISRAPFASSGGKWQGIALQKHISHLDYVRTNFAVHSNLMHIFTGVPVSREWRYDGHTYRVQNTTGSVMLAPKGLQASVRAVRTRPDVQWILELAPSPSQEFSNGKKLDLTPRLNLRDAQLVRLVQLLQTEVEKGSPTGSLFGETIGNSLMVYLAQHYSTAVGRQEHCRGGLPRLRLKRVLDYIEANLSRDIHLDELAETAGLSLFHFATLFKQPTGASPASVHSAPPTRASQGTAAKARDDLERNQLGGRLRGPKPLHECLSTTCGRTAVKVSLVALMPARIKHRSRKKSLLICCLVRCTAGRCGHENPSFFTPRHRRTGVRHFCPRPTS